MPEESAARFRFKINDVFTITGRGTAVVGFIEQAVVRAGDRLQLIRSDGNVGPVIACRSVGFVDRPGWRPGDPVAVGLIVAGLSELDAVRVPCSCSRSAGRRSRPCPPRTPHPASRLTDSCSSGQGRLRSASPIVAVEASVIRRSAWPAILDDRQLSGAELGDLGPCSRKRAVSRRCRAAAATSAAVCQAPRRIEIMRAG